MAYPGPRAVAVNAGKPGMRGYPGHMLSSRTAGNDLIGSISQEIAVQWRSMCLGLQKATMPQNFYDGFRLIKEHGVRGDM